MPDSNAKELLALNQQLLEAIAAGDWKTYERLCDPTLSCFEPEARGQLVSGLGFHRFYFELKGDGKPRSTTMTSPEVRVMGDVAIVAYVRLVQTVNEAGQPGTSSSEETRIWQRQQGSWRHVHFHRSACS